ncbi:MAG TPA: trypsin-like peptidase domain-containing protein [Acidimicrobiia bacterium]|nr:trypsin-like peptidase domain-containing protein [Acidimicrobiia bacterium]
MTDIGPPGPQVRDEPEEPAEGFEDVPVPEPSRRRSRPDSWTVVMGIIGGALLGTGLTLAILGFTGVFEEPEPPPVPTNPPPPTLTVPPPTSTPAPVVIESGNVTDVAARAIPSIIAVETRGLLGDGGGSGVVYSDDGYIITNHHVVSGANDLTVVFSDGGRWQSDLIGSDELTDLAVIRVSRGDLTPIDIGSSNSLTIGERAVAVGNPLALEGGPSVTYGIVSALNRSLGVESGEVLYGMIQTDAPITRGSSGGALLDSTARLVGITTAIAVSDVGAEGLGFAIPIDMALGVANDLIETGVVHHAQLGIQGETALAEADGAEYPVGVRVTSVSPGSAFEVAGGRASDVITAIDDAPINSMETLLTELRTRRAGEAVSMAVTRSSAPADLTVVLDERT